MCIRETTNNDIGTNQPKVDKAQGTARQS